MQKRWLCLILSFVLVLSAFPLQNAVYKADNSNALVQNGGFEQGMEGWIMSHSYGFSVTDADAYASSHALFCVSGGTQIYQSIKLEAGKTYQLSFWGKSYQQNITSSVWCNVNSDAMTYANAAVLITASNSADWEEYAQTFTVPQTGVYYLNIGNPTGKTNSYVIDRVDVKEWIENVLVNGGFEDGFAGWTKSGLYGFGIVDSAAYDGTNSLLCTSGGNQLSQAIELDAKKTYRLQFYGKSYDLSKNSAVWCNVNSAVATYANAVTLITVSNSEDWVKYVQVFNVPATGIYYLNIGNPSGNTNSYCIDEIIITETEKTYLSNGDFESGFDYWEKGNGYYSYDLSEAEPQSGRYALAARGGKYQYIFQKVYLTKGKYTYSFHAKCSVGFVWSMISSVKEDSSEEARLTLLKTESETDWTQYTAVFTVSEDGVYYVIFKNLGTSNDVEIDNVFLTKFHIVENGGFEEELQPWTKGSDYYQFTITDAQKKSGAFSLQSYGGKYQYLYQGIELEAEKNYALTFSAKCTNGFCWATVSKTQGDTDLSTCRAILKTDCSSDWVDYKTVFSVQETGTYFLNFKNLDTFNRIYIDDVAIKEEEILNNGDFENNGDEWQFDPNYFEISNMGYNGTKAMAVKNGYHQLLSGILSVTEQTNYKLNFRYKGSLPKGAATFAISTEPGFNSQKIIAKGDLKDAWDWENAECVFSSGDHTVLYLVFQTMEDAAYLLDDITVNPTNESASVFQFTPAVIKQYIRNGYYYNTNSFKTLTAEEQSKNVLPNYDFEATGGYADLANGTNITVQSGAGFDSEKGLHFDLGDTVTETYIPICVDQNTTYLLSFFIKADGYRAAKKTNFTYSFTEPDTGKYILPMGGNTLSMNENRSANAAVYDGKWHMTGFLFTTMDAKRLNLSFKGNNADICIDKICIYKFNAANLNAQGTAYTAPLLGLKDISITSDHPDRLGVDDESHNLVINFDFSEGESFWSDVTSAAYGSTVRVEDSFHAVQGKTLVYRSNRKYCHNLYYIKWIDIQPHTDYIFSAKLLVTQTGDGHFAVISGQKTTYDTEILNNVENVIMPTILRAYDFKTLNYTAGEAWKTVGFSFNSQDRNRIGIAILDAGGEAYIDDIRIFKAANAAILNEQVVDVPDRFETIVSGISVADRIISGVEEKTKLSDVVSKFAGSRFIRVFGSDGIEVTDFTMYSGTDMELRMMDGPIIKASAKLLVCGDMNSDGRMDIKDLICMKKEFVKIDMAWFTDVNSDGEKNSADLTSLKKMLLKR